MKKIFIVNFILFFLFFPSISFATNYSADANCMGAWPMEYNDTHSEFDLSGENGTITVTADDAIIRSTDKLFGNYSRDIERGDSEHFTHADGLSTDISGANQKLSIVAFYKRESLTEGSEEVVRKHTAASGGRQYLLFYNDNTGNNFIQFNIGYNSGNNFRAAQGATAMGTGGWQSMIGVYNDIDIRIYLDGSLDSNGSNNPRAHTDGISDGDQPLLVGRTRTDGLLDDIGIFDRDLSSVEASDIDTNGLGIILPDRRQIIIISKLEAEYQKEIDRL